MWNLPNVASYWKSAATGTRLVCALLITLATGSVSADDFNWGPSLGTINTGNGSYFINGLGFTSPVENQGCYGTCWDFSAVTSFESKYMLTRNDTVYSMLLSEEQGPMLLGGTEAAFDSGTWPSVVMIQACSGGGIVQASALPYVGPNPPSQYWPLQPGWQNQAVVSTGWANVQGSVATLQTALKTYGPGVICIDGNTYFYYPNSADATSVPGIDINHAVSVVGYHDATSADDAAIHAAGGYWIIKNSWGTGFCDSGYGFVPYNLINDICFSTGPAYFTGALATATWQGPGTWATGGSNWTSGGSACSWGNQETAAVFNASANSTITISGPAIAHSLIFNSGATGYTFSGGSLTVTAGGIIANESVTINSLVTIGAPQTWITAAGKTLTVNGNVNTNISTLTIAGAGATTINGAVGDGGPMLGIGGGLTLCSPAMLTLTGSNTYSNLTAVNGGTLVLSGSGGAIALSSGITLSGGTLLLDNSAANNPNRIGSTVPLTLQGGELSLAGNAAGTAQAARSLLLRPGDNVVSVAASSNVASLTMGSLTRSAGDVAMVCGSSLGSASSGSVAQILFSTAPTLSNSGSGSGIGILPYFYGDNSPRGGGTDLVTYGSNGLRLLTANEYSGTVVAGANVKLTSSANVSASTSILALVLANSGSDPQLTIGNSATLTLTSGAVLSTGSSNSISDGSITFGDNAATSYEGIVHTAANLMIGSIVTDNAGNAVTLTKSGPAALVLTGNNTYSGGTFISGGILQLGAGGNSGSICGSIADMGTLAICRSDNIALNSNVSGSGGVSQLGGNRTTLNGRISYTGMTAVSAGTLVVSAGTASGGSTIAAGATLQLGSRADNGWVSGGVNDSGSLVFDREDNLTFCDNISGNGRLLQLGTGGTTLSGSNTYTGGTTVIAGALSAVGTASLPGCSTSGSVSVAAGATLAVQPWNGATGWNSLQISTLLSSVTWSSCAAFGIDTSNGNSTYSGNVITSNGNSVNLNLPQGLWLAKMGANTLLLTGTNTCTGGAIVNNGILDVAGTASLPGYNLANTISVAGGAVLAVQPGNGTTGWSNTQINTLLSAVNWSNSTAALGIDTTDGNYTYGGNIKQALGLAKVGANALTLIGANTYPGPTIVSGGTLQLGDGVTGNDASLATSSIIMNGAGANLVYNVAVSQTANYPISVSPNLVSTGNDNLIKAGPGVLTIGNTVAFGGLDGNYNSLGIVIIHQGAINVTAAGALTNTGEIDVGDTAGQTGTLRISSSTALVLCSGSSYNNTQGFSGVYVGINGGTGHLTLTGNAVLDATQVIPLGGGSDVISIGVNTSTSPGVGTVTVAGNSIMRAGSGYGTNPSYITVGEGGSGDLTIQDQGLVQANFFYLGSQEWFGISGGSGTLHLNGGTLSVPAVGNDSGTTGNLYFNGGTLQATADSSSFLNVRGTFHGYVQSGGAVIDSNGHNITINQALLTGVSLPATDGGLAKVGNGILTMAATNTYSGNTLVIGGTLALGSPLALQQSTLNTSGSGALSFGALTSATLGGLTGSGTLDLSNTASVGVIVNVGNNNASTTFSGDLSGAGSLTKVGRGVLVLSGTDSYFGGTIVDAGTLCVTNASAIPDGMSLTVGAGGTFIFDPLPAAGAPVTSSAATATVPEPGTRMLLAAGALGLAGYGLRRRAASRTAKPAAFDESQDARPILAFQSHSTTASAAQRAV